MKKKIQKHYKNYIFLVSNFIYPHRMEINFNKHIKKMDYSRLKKTE